MIYLKLILVIIIRTLGDVSFKAAVHKLDFNSISDFKGNLKKMITSPFLWMGFGFGLANMVAWGMSLEDFDLSYAYPFLSISYVTIILTGTLLFKETLDKNKIIGILFIVAGALTLFLG
jgi:multidrug transporter EmrE-like cation transporter